METGVKIEKKRDVLKDAFPEVEKWAEKVDAMTEQQVKETYSRLKSQGKVQ